jgi:hypothetical protein
MEEVERWGYPGLVMLMNDIWGGHRFSRKEIIAGDRGSLSCHRLDCLDSSAETHSKNSILVLLRNHDDQLGFCLL